MQLVLQYLISICWLLHSVRYIAHRIENALRCICLQKNMQLGNINQCSLALLIFFCNRHGIMRQVQFSLTKSTACAPAEAIRVKLELCTDWRTWYFKRRQVRRRIIWIIRVTLTAHYCITSSSVLTFCSKCACASYVLLFPVVESVVQYTVMC